MQICGFQKTTLLDYPGAVASIIFLGGCNFDCPFCQNSPLVHDVNSQPSISKEEVLSHLKKRRGILDGICISGGEPTLAPDLLPFMEEIKAIGCKIKLDTNGSRPDIVAKAIESGLVDYIAMDIKSSLKDYGRLCHIPQMDTSPIEDTVRILQTSNITYEFRTTVLKPYHTDENFLEIGEWLKGVSPYYLQVFKDSEQVRTHGLSPFTEEEMLHTRQLLLPCLPNTQLRGM